jgi:hypothetical protein
MESDVMKARRTRQDFFYYGMFGENSNTTELFRELVRAIAGEVT